MTNVNSSMFLSVLVALVWLGPGVVFILAWLNKHIRKLDYPRIGLSFRGRQLLSIEFHIVQGRGSRISLSPSLNAAFLFYLCMSRQNADAITGDLDEGYKALLKKFGRRRATVWYWWQTFISLWPIVWVAMKKSLMKPAIAAVTWAVGSGLIKHDGWMAALMELWKKIAGA